MNSKNIDSNASSNFDEISLKDLILKIGKLWRYLLTKWLTILFFALSGGLLGLSYAYFKKPLYTATTTFVLEDEKGGSGLGSLAGLASIAGVDLGVGGGGIFQGDNILALYKSRAMIEKTLLTEILLDGKKQLLIDRYVEYNQLREKWASKPNLKDFRFDLIQTSNPSGPDRLRDSILGSVVSDISKVYLSATKPDKKLSIINVSVNSKDEVFAKTFNDAIVENVNDFYVSTKTKKSLDNVNILQHKTDSVRRVMNGDINTAVAVADATPNLNPTRQIQRVAPAQRAQFSAETNKAVLGEMVKNLEMTKMALLKETPLIQVVDRPVFPLENNKISMAKGGVVGAVLAGFLIVVYLILRKILIDL